MITTSKGEIDSNTIIVGSLVVQMVKNSSAMQETWVQSLGWEEIPWRRALQPAPVFLPGESPRIEEPGWGCKESDMTEQLSTQHNINTLFTPNDRSSRHKINKKTQDLSDTLDQLDLVDIYRTFHPKTIYFTFFSSAHGTFSRTDHILGHKSSLGKLKGE